MSAGAWYGAIMLVMLVGPPHGHMCLSSRVEAPRGMGAGLVRTGTLAIEATRADGRTRSSVGHRHVRWSRALGFGQSWAGGH